MKKAKILLFILAIATMSVFAGCSSDQDTAPTQEDDTAAGEIKVATLKGPTGMGMVEVITQEQDKYSFELASSPDEITGSIISGDIDIAAIPTNLAATIYQKTQGKVQVAAVNTLGVLYILEKGNSLETMADLSGARILSAGQGTTAEYVLNYLLEENGLYIDENITVDYASEHSEVAAQAQAGEYDIVVLPEPFVTSLTTADPEFRIALDLTQEWENTGAGQLAMGCLVVQKDFAENNPQGLSEFMDAYKNSVEYVNTNPKEAAADMEAQDIIKAAVGEKAIPNCNIVYITGEDMKSALDTFYNVIYQANPQSIGGELPSDDFYLTDF